MPLKKGPKNLEANFHELRHGKQYARTAEEHGKDTARRQMVAIALKEARKRADGGKLDEPIDDATGQFFPEAIANPIVGSLAKGLGQSAVDYASTPGKVMQPNPYPQGSEEASWYDDNRQKVISDWANQAAMNSLTSGVPMAKPGSLGMAGGRLSNFLDVIEGKAKPAFDPVDQANWIWQTAKGKPKAAMDLLEQQKQRQFMRWTPEEIARGEHGGQTPEQWGQVENALKENFNKPFVSDAMLDKVSEYAQDVLDNKGSVALDDLKKKFPKMDDATLAGIVSKYHKDKGGSVRKAISQVRRAKGGKVLEGAIRTPHGGRTDTKNAAVADGSYILPADFVSHLGQSNSESGLRVAEHMFGPSSEYAKKGSQHRAGGKASMGKPVDCVLAGGEYAIGPNTIRGIGNGDIELGHRILDAMVMKGRKDHVETLKSLPGPAQD